MLAGVLAAVLALALAGCGGSQAGTAAFGPSHSVVSNGSTSSGVQSGAGGTTAGAPPQASSADSKASQNLGPGVYLIKSLQVNLATQDPRQSATDLQQWISATDPRSQSAGVDYEQQDDGTYTVQMTFSVQSSLYPQIESYLAGYASAHHGRLLHLQESVQDVTNEYVDLQSRLTNLREEQQRLLDLMAHSGNLSDTITIEQRLSDVEGQIEQIEGRQKQLDAQTTFYTVTIYLVPLSSVAHSPQPTPWNPGGVLGDAWSAALAFGESLASLGIWLAVFGMYIVPVALLSWLVWRRMRPRKPVTTP
jgi:uncharacterized protein DUF4349